MPNIFTVEPNVPVQEEEQWNVLVSTAESWVEQRRIKSFRPRRSYTLQFRAKTLAQSVQVFDFYNGQSGDANTFYWENPLESPVAGEVLGSGDGAASVFYTDHAPLASGSYVIRVQGTQKTEGTQYTVSGGTGAVTFKAGSLPGSGQEVQMDYGFYRIVRFEGRPSRSLIGHKLVDISCKFMEVL